MALVLIVYILGVIAFAALMLSDGGLESAIVPVALAWPLVAIMVVGMAVGVVCISVMSVMSRRA